VQHPPVGAVLHLHGRNRCKPAGEAKRRFHQPDYA
jgi:hypothetical protein